MKELTVSEIMARAKYKKAMALIEQAQRTLSDACGELCPLIGAIEEWESCGKAYDDIHNLWRKVAYSSARDNVRMDDR